MKLRTIIKINCMVTHLSGIAFLGCALFLIFFNYYVHLLWLIPVGIFFYMANTKIDADLIYGGVI